MTNNNPQGNRGVALATSLAIPGALAQALNNVFASAIRQAFGAAGASPLQALTASLTVSFLAAFGIGVVLWFAYRGTSKAFTWHCSRAVFWVHQRRLVLGLLTTIFVFGSAQSGQVPVALVTTLLSASPIYLAFWDAFRRQRWGGVPIAGIGFAGIVIVSSNALASGVSGLSFGLLAALASGVTLAALKLTQSELVKTHDQAPAKIVGIFGFQAFVVCAFAFGVATAYGTVPPVTVSVVGPTSGLMIAYALSQLLLQVANGFGNPVLVGILEYTGIPFGLVIDAVLGTTPTLNQVIGSVVIMLAAGVAQVAASRRR
jgi:hypothetical protein